MTAFRRTARRLRPSRTRLGGGRLGSGTAVAGVRVGVLGGQRLGDALEDLALGLDAEEDLDDPADDHQRGAEEVPAAICVMSSRRGVVDELAEQQRPGDAAGRGADRVEERDAQRPGLHREDLADGQVGGAGAGRGEEEDHHAGDRQGDRVRAPEAEARDAQQHAGEDVGAGDHPDAADGVEQRAEQRARRRSCSPRRPRCTSRSA